MDNSIINHPRLDETFKWLHGEGIPGKAGCCRIRIYCNNENIQASDRWVIIASEIRKNKGQSITNCVEFLFRKVCDRYSMNSELTTWIEHYNKDSYNDIDREEEYSLVTLSVGAKPSWRYLKTEEVEALIEEI